MPRAITGLVRVSIGGNLYNTTTAPPLETWVTSTWWIGTGLDDVPAGGQTACNSVMTAAATFLGLSSFTNLMDLTMAKIAVVDDSGHYTAPAFITTAAQRANVGGGTNANPGQVCYVISLRGANTLDKHERGRCYLPGPAGGSAQSCAYWTGTQPTTVTAAMKTYTAAVRTALNGVFFTSGAAWVIREKNGSSHNVAKIMCALKPGIQRRRERSVPNTYSTAVTIP